MLVSDFILARLAADELRARDPRDLADIEAKRKIVTILRQVAEDDTAHIGWVRFAEEPLVVLAKLWIDHPDYRLIEPSIRVIPA